MNDMNLNTFYLEKTEKGIAAFHNYKAKDKKVHSSESFWDKMMGKTKKKDRN